MVTKLYNSYAIGVVVAIFSFIAGMEMQSFLIVKNSQLFAAIYDQPSKIENNVLTSSNSFGAICMYYSIN